MMTFPVALGRSVFVSTSPGVYMFLLCPPNPAVRLVNHMANYDVHEPSLLQGARAFAHLTMNFMEHPYAVCRVNLIHFQLCIDFQQGVTRPYRLSEKALGSDGRTHL